MDAFDPPYKLQGSPLGTEMDKRYGTGERRGVSAITRLMVDGMTEGYRLTSRWLLVKTMNQVAGGHIHWLEDYATAYSQRLGLEKWDHLLLRGGRPQPGGRSQQHARRNYSSLLVFLKGKY